ncbi:DUF4142 domain-containing protein [Allobranchiibius sp. CTAmp26]|uniref:DUF4142 domain-containing protein n=1 Tax=Allobranchiibius sp. CTAmp26 TaxID=2815214 RepID=UPI001AA16B64|nr:DUF4142 domain-containing protein [Allobranchiibius sp. CTAmp26]MBO1756485.1 DUF4142 domain-containing protein [Allobranchiibius sp. CTAmp26]
MSTHRTRYITLTGASLAIAATCIPATAFAATSPSTADKTFVAANEQVNLAEIAISQLVMTHSSSAAVHTLAQKTVSDHMAAKAKLMAVAGKLGLTLPTAPNAMQQAQAAQLKGLTGSSFDQLYLRDQVAGHKMSIAGTNTEISTGSSTSVVSYARAYLPVAQMHLSMAQADLAAISGGGPGSVQAGSGGQAATNGSTDLRLGWSAGAVGLALLGGGAVYADRRRRALQ